MEQQRNGNEAQLFESLSRPLSQDEAAWARCAWRAACAGREAALPLLGREEGRAVLGRGQGGDQTIELDRRAEDMVLASLRDSSPYPYRLVSEEVGVIEGGTGEWHVVVDPVDGSLNAKRGLDPCCTVVAVAQGASLADVSVGVLAEFRGGMGFLTVRGAGFASTVKRDPPAGDVELILLEAGRPDLHDLRYRDLSRFAPEGGRLGVRVRQLGSLALSMAELAAGAGDVLIAPVPSRAVDIAAGLLMIAEAGGGAASLDASVLLAQPLDVKRRAPFVAWRSGLDAERILATARAVFPVAG